MQRITISADDEFLEEIEALCALRGYQNRSEAIRDLTRAGLRQAREESDETGQCVAALVYVYDHSARELSKRLADTFHDHHDLSLAATHIHLDHESCLEVAILSGAGKDVQHLADHVIAERGVRFGRLVKIPVDAKTEIHRHHDTNHSHLHLHVRKAG